MNAKDRRIEELQRMVAELQALVGELKQENRQLRERIAELELQLAQARKDSSTSSKPPSSDLVKPPEKKGRDRRKKRKRGGQPGHPRQTRQPLPPEQVDETYDHELPDDEVARQQLTPTDEWEVFQQIEYVERPIHVTEHRLRVYRRPDGSRVIPRVPQARQPLFGPRMLAMIGWLKSKAHCSYSTLQEWFEDVLGVSVSRGYLAKLCNGTISASLKNSYEEVETAIPHEGQLSSDETGLKENGRKLWIWCIAGQMFTLYHIAESRSRAVLEKLVGQEFQGYLNFDYFSSNCSFAWNYDIQAQYCWAHLIRDIRFLLGHPDASTRDWAEQLLERARRLFSAWHRREEMSPEGRRRSLLTHRDRFLTVMRSTPASKAASNLAARFQIVEYQRQGQAEVERYDLSQDYFRFLFVDGLEPTNNHGEQQLRHCAIDRRITQGTRSEAGRRYHERMWTALATCAKQQRSFFDFLHASLLAHLTDQPSPSLLAS